MKTFYNVNPDEILKEFNSSALGLDDTQVSLNREKYGKNKLEEKEKKKIIVSTIKILEEDIQFLEKLKAEYIELKKEISAKRKEKLSWLKKEIDNLEDIEEKIYGIEGSDWISRKISEIKREIQKDRSWIKKFNNIS